MSRGMRRRGDFMLKAGPVRVVWWSAERLPTRMRRVWALAPAIVVDVGSVGVKIRLGRGVLDADRPEFPLSTLRHVALGPLWLTFRRGVAMRGCAR